MIRLSPRLTTPVVAPEAASEVAPEVAPRVVPKVAAVGVLALADRVPPGDVSALVPVVVMNTVTSPEIVALHAFTLVENFLQSSRKATMSCFVVESMEYLRKKSVYGTYMLQICHAPVHVDTT